MLLEHRARPDRAALVGVQRETLLDRFEPRFGGARKPAGSRRCAAFEAAGAGRALFLAPDESSFPTARPSRCSRARRRGRRAGLAGDEDAEAAAARRERWRAPPRSAEGVSSAGASGCGGGSRRSRRPCAASVPAAIVAAGVLASPPRAWCASGAGSSSRTRACWCRCSVELGVPARCAPPCALLGPPGPAAAEDLLVLFSQGLSPNGRAPLARARAWRGVVLVTGADDAGDPSAPAPSRARRGGGPSAAHARTGRGRPACCASSARCSAPSRRSSWRGRSRAAAARAHPGRHSMATPSPPRLGEAAARGRTLRVGAAGDPLRGASRSSPAGRAPPAPAASPASCSKACWCRCRRSSTSSTSPTAASSSSSRGPRRSSPCSRRALPRRSALVDRAEAMLDGARHRVLRLIARLPSPYALLEHEVMLNELLLASVEARGIDPARWPGQGRDAPLYALEAAPEEAASPARAARARAPRLAGARGAPRPRRRHGGRAPRLDGAARAPPPLRDGHLARRRRSPRRSAPACPRRCACPPSPSGAPPSTSPSRAPSTSAARPSPPCSRTSSRPSAATASATCSSSPPTEATASSCAAPPSASRGRRRARG